VSCFLLNALPNPPNEGVEVVPPNEGVEVVPKLNVGAVLTAGFLFSVAAVVVLEAPKVKFDKADFSAVPVVRVAAGANGLEDVLNGNAGSLDASVEVFVVDEGSEVGNLKPVDAGAAIEAVREEGGESVISILSSNSCGIADAGATEGESFLGGCSAAAGCVCGAPSLKDVDIAEPKEEGAKDGAALADSVSLVAVPFVAGAAVVVEVAGAPNNGVADSVLGLEAVVPKLNPPPNAGAAVTGAAGSIFCS